MEWQDNFYKLFPDGIVPTYPGLTLEFLINNNIDVIVIIHKEYDMDMLRSIKRYMYHKDGSFLINTLFDLQNEHRHIQGICALSDYGAKMLSENLKERNISIDLPPNPSDANEISVLIKEENGIRYIESLLS